MSSDSSVSLRAVTLPDKDYRRRYEALVGVDQIKDELLLALRFVANPNAIKEWANKNPGVHEAVNLLLARPNLFIFGGDVGTGKTELAETIGDVLARAEDISVTLFTLSLAARGTGFVGEMTQRIVGAFDEVRSWAEKRTPSTTRAKFVGILFIDEADAIAQSREYYQMHHEDRAGVNALIRGIDDLTRGQLPVAVLMATNRLSALDPAVLRRAARVFTFSRPDEQQRHAVFSKYFPKFENSNIDKLVAATGPSTGKVGFTYSDIVQRLIPSAVLAAFRERRSLTISDIVEAASRTGPTPPFALEQT